MRHTVWKVFYNYEKEEQWLNDMSEKGLALIDYFWTRYVFEDGVPGEYIYRLEFLPHSSSHPESIKYLTFMQELGIEHIASYMHWVTLRKKAAEGPFEIYTDPVSRIALCRRLSRWWLSIAAIEFVVCLYEICIFLFFHGADGLSGNIAPLVAAAVLFLTGLCLLSLGLPLRRKMKQYQKEKNYFEC